MNVWVNTELLRECILFKIKSEFSKYLDIFGYFLLVPCGSVSIGTFGNSASRKSSFGLSLLKSVSMCSGSDSMICFQKVDLVNGSQFLSQVAVSNLFSICIAIRYANGMFHFQKVSISNERVRPEWWRNWTVWFGILIATLQNFGVVVKNLYDWTFLLLTRSNMFIL